MYTSALDDQFGEILKRISPANRRLYARNVSLALRAYRSDEILANRNADGSEMQARKAQRYSKRRHKLKSGKMFKKIGRRSNMRIKANASFASVAFKPQSEYVAEVHQYGKTIRVNQYGTRVKYPKRTLLGMGPIEEKIILDHLSDFIAEAL